MLTIIKRRKNMFEELRYLGYKIIDIPHDEESCKTYAFAKFSNKCYVVVSYTVSDGFECCGYETKDEVTDMQFIESFVNMVTNHVEFNVRSFDVGMHEALGYAN